MLPNKVCFPLWLPAVGNLSRMTPYAHFFTKSTPPLPRYLFISSCRLSIVVVPISYQAEADAIISCAYSPDEVVHILHTAVILPAELFCVLSRKETVLSLSVSADQARSK